MSNAAKTAMQAAIRHAEKFAAVLTADVRRDIALGRVTLWARSQDSGATERLAENVIAMGDAIVSHYSEL